MHDGVHGSDALLRDLHPQAPYFALLTRAPEGYDVKKAVISKVWPTCLPFPPASYIRM